MIPDECFDLGQQVGTHVRFKHIGCSEGKDSALVITRTEVGWKWFCHRCRKGGNRYLAGMTPQQYIQWQNQEVKPNQVVKKVRLPLDFTRTLPPIGLAWLYSYGITETDMDQHTFGYSRYYNRLIMPIFKDGELVYWSGRNLGDYGPKNPKYMNVRSERGDVWFERSDHGKTDVVLVEDILSAIRVGHHADSRALLYASVPDALVLQLIAQGYQTVHVWLDPDKAAEMFQYTNRFRTFGINCVMHITNKDPKCYSDEQIRREIYGR